MGHSHVRAAQHPQGGWAGAQVGLSCRGQRMMTGAVEGHGPARRLLPPSAGSLRCAGCRMTFPAASEASRQPSWGGILGWGLREHK